MKSNSLSLLGEGVLLVAVVLSPILILASIVIGTLDPPRFAHVAVEGLCCQLVAEAAQRELTAIDGVIDFTPDFQEQTLRLELRRSQATSPRAIWEAVERTSLRPIRLVTKAGTFDERPVE